MKINKPYFLKTLLTLIIASGVFSTPVFADEYHYHDILIGDRAAGLGGAYTAVADDASGLYYNPAGIVYSPTPKISGSVNAYNYKTTEYSNINESNHKWTRTSSGMVANYFGVVQPLGNKSSVGFSIAIPNYDLEDQSDEFTNFKGSKALENNLGISTINENFIDFNNEDNTTLAGVSYAFQASKEWSFGVTLYGYFRKKETTNWQYVRATGSQGNNGQGNTPTIFEGTFYQKIQTEEFGLQPRLGVMWAPANKLSVGLMVQKTFIMSQSPEARNYARYSACEQDAGNNNQYTNCTTYDNSIEQLDLNAPGIVPELQTIDDNDLPYETNIGVAYFASDSVMYTADFRYATETDVYEATWNAAAGAEYFLNQTWAIRGGLYTNRANTDTDVSKTKQDHVDLYGGSFSLSRYTKGANITAGINYSTGSGEADLNTSTTKVQKVTVNSLNLFISTSASF